MEMWNNRIFTLSNFLIIISTSSPVRLMTAQMRSGKWLVLEKCMVKQHQRHLQNLIFEVMQIRAQWLSKTEAFQSGNVEQLAGTQSVPRPA